MSMNLPDIQSQMTNSKYRRRSWTKNIQAPLLTVLKREEAWASLNRLKALLAFNRFADHECVTHWLVET